MLETQEEAHRLLASGLPITLCPQGSKKPLGDGWDATHVGKAWQKKTWSRREVDKAFKVRGALNVGVLFGPRSNLIDIEEDSPAAADDFRALMVGCSPPITPCFTSPRGRHRLVQWRPELESIGKATIHFGSLEIKLGAGGKGAHSLFPPSVSDGKGRQWLNSLEEIPAAPICDTLLGRLFEAGGVEKTQKMRSAVGGEEDTGNGTQKTQISHESLVSSVSSVSTLPTNTSPSPTDDPHFHKIQQAVTATVPRVAGVRHRAVFEFARHLKSIRAIADYSEDQLRPYVEWWHELALPVITTKAFEETWYDFRTGWRAVKFPAGTGPLSVLKSAALSKTPPKCAEAYSQPELKALVALCRELQDRAGNDPFFLACRAAGQEIGVDHRIAARWLKMLCMDGVLLLDEQGKMHAASEYRYMKD